MLSVLFVGSCAKQMNVKTEEVTTTNQKNTSGLTDASTCSPQILFISDRNGNGDIYSYNPISLETKSFAIADSSINDLAYNRYSNTVVFLQQVSGKKNLYKKDIVSGEVSFLMESPAEEIPAWSPEQNVIAYSKKIGTEQYSLVIQNLTTQSIQVIYEKALQPLEPNWSPDGAKLVFTLTDSLNNADIAIINPDGSDFKNLTKTEKIEGNPSWNPSGEKLLFFRMIDNHANLFEYVIDTDELIPLTYGQKNQFFGKYSSDGSKIVYVGDTDGNWDLFMMNSDGNNKSQLTFNPAFDGNPIWLPCK